MNYRYKFEYEEEKGWFAFRISTIALPKDIGRWQCRIKMIMQNGTVYRFESRKTIHVR